MTTLVEESKMTVDSLIARATSRGPMKRRFNMRSTWWECICKRKIPTELTNVFVSIPIMRSGRHLHVKFHIRAAT